MNFLEAHRTVAAFSGGEELSFLLAASGTIDPLDIYLKAHGARRSRAVRYRGLPFNTLTQWSFSPAEENESEVILLFPWDLVPEADWRSGVPTAPVDEEAVEQRAAELVGRLGKRRSARILYVPAALPPLFPDQRQDAELELTLVGLVRSAGGRILAPEIFSLGSYLGSGSPFASPMLSEVAAAVIEAATTPLTPAKVLITDLDQVMWSGIIGEDGVDGVSCAPEGVGFKHFLYQTVLAKLEREGILIAAVSRNDPDLAAAPFRQGKTVLKESQMVSLLASYHAKSAQISTLAANLSLGLDSFVFVDDNPVELAEVSAAHPSVRCIQFPSAEDRLPAFFDELGSAFSRSIVTEEDRQRTELYRRRLAGVVPDDATGADLTGFLRGLGMRLEIHDRSVGDRTRAVQLINKTNQFNLNGRRLEDEAVAETISGGGRLFTATLEDRNGSHGEILACLITGDGTMTSLVMSCRVLQRRVEQAFFVWLCQRGVAPRVLDFIPTERNTPLRKFLEGRAFVDGPEGNLQFSPDLYLEDHPGDFELFEIVEPRQEEARIAATTL